MCAQADAGEGRVEAGGEQQEEDQGGREDLQGGDEAGGVVQGEELVEGVEDGDEQRKHRGPHEGLSWFHGGLDRAGGLRFAGTVVPEACLISAWFTRDSWSR